ncbi:carbohydrate-binding module family 13 protein [Phycomyces blakesleeanus]|uniref:Carbohydrate-binding module family 13 protein n=2 Tax=Phycomyces blakesleeanus TaxID=4837 RepID=A0A167P735_PHYB8|nr:carbohydrate-binding module family 13 protein [Phycomyces blakesleeanus NRRL 1555(-)]OAD77374.1 carbohydrate-binding module family 13 protein [Phycomyces blakesleeanus NRRL 1555(-)]|eukprot:XP_018295414.1 carbohydrate-binding module family 13 protein [Phycomyces blakesleeanus NRRL 1555(-)]
MTYGPLYFIKSHFNGRVIDVEEGSTEDDATIIVYTQKSEDCLNQLWRYEDGYFINAKSAKALDIRGGEMNEESQICQWQQKQPEEAANQRWSIDEEGYIFCDARPDLVLDIAGGEDDDGVPVILYGKREGEVASNQRWYLVECELY